MPLSLRPGSAHFRVYEIPAYTLKGSGEHLCCLLEKENLTTEQCVKALSRCHKVPHKNIGYAGRKDRHGITRQWFSIQYGTEEQFDNLHDFIPEDGRIEILELNRHHKKIKIGHLAGNRFALDLASDNNDLSSAQQSITELASNGIPNLFGKQRFGAHGTNVALAQALGKHHWQQAAALCLDPSGAWQWGDPIPDIYINDPVGRFFARHRQAGSDYTADLAAVRSDLRRFGRGWRFITSAAQSAIFNAVLTARQEAGLLYQVLAGEWGFAGKRIEMVQTRCCSDPHQGLVGSGPLPGSKMKQPKQELLEQEQAWSAHLGLDWHWFTRPGPLAASGERRPLVIPFLEQPQWNGLCLSFALGPGAYATTVLDAAGILIPQSRHDEPKRHQASQQYNDPGESDSL